MKILFISYLIVLVWVILFKMRLDILDFIYQGVYNSTRSLNLSPFSASGGRAEVAFNFVIFIPYGCFLISLFEKWSFVKELMIIFLTSLLLEILQYLLAVGATDVTDLLVNTFGGLTGMLLFSLFSKLFGKKEADKSLLTLSFGSAVLVIIYIIKRILS
ncbi:VanZ family protein [Lactococcus hodotermopsidis]|nr:VanZ family protein [Lactococcus hodotermopsidis]